MIIVVDASNVDYRNSRSIPSSSSSISVPEHDLMMSSLTPPTKSGFMKCCVEYHINSYDDDDRDRIDDDDGDDG